MKTIPGANLRELINKYKGTHSLTEDDQLAIVENLITEIIGDDLEREGLVDTPRRVLKTIKELLQEGYQPVPEKVITTFSDEDYSEIVVVKDIPFISFCEHHLLPFSGLCWVGYLSNGRIIGASKIPRIVKHFSSRLQNQERLTHQIVTFLQRELKPLGCGAVIKAYHLCMVARGVKSHSSYLTTTALAGHFLINPQVKAEFLGGIPRGFKKVW